MIHNLLRNPKEEPLEQTAACMCPETYLIIVILIPLQIFSFLLTLSWLIWYRRRLLRRYQVSEHSFDSLAVEGIYGNLPKIGSKPGSSKSNSRRSSVNLSRRGSTAYDKIDIPEQITEESLNQSQSSVNTNTSGNTSRTEYTVMPHSPRIKPTPTSTPRTRKGSFIKRVIQSKKLNKSSHVVTDMEIDTSQN